MRTVRRTRLGRTSGTLALALVTVILTARIGSADPVRVSFTAHPAANDPVNTGPSTGTFTFDSSLVVPGALVSDAANGLATDVSFFWGSTLFDITTADLIEMRFDAAGALEFWHLGGRAASLTSWVSQPGEQVVDDFSISPGGPGRSFFYTLQGRAGTFQGRVTADPAPVPEPATWLLLGSGAVALLRRRRSRGTEQHD